MGMKRFFLLKVVSCFPRTFSSHVCCDRRVIPDLFPLNYSRCQNSLLSFFFWVWKWMLMTIEGKRSVWICVTQFESVLFIQSITRLLSHEGLTPFEAHHFYADVLHCTVECFLFVSRGPSFLCHHHCLVRREWFHAEISHPQVWNERERDCSLSRLGMNYPIHCPTSIGRTERCRQTMKVKYPPERVSFLPWSCL